MYGELSTKWDTDNTLLPTRLRGSAWVIQKTIIATNSGCLQWNNNMPLHTWSHTAMTARDASVWAPPPAEYLLQVDGCWLTEGEISWCTWSWRGYTYSRRCSMALQAGLRELNEFINRSQEIERESWERERESIADDRWGVDLTNIA